MTITKHKLETIEPIAVELWHELKPHCELIKIAGSIRRRKPECKDIELVLLPHNRNQIGMFFLNNGRVLKGKFSGRYVKAFYKGFQVDIFIPQPHDYYRQLAIRTGSAEYAKQIATTWVKKGYMGTPEGLKRNDFNIEANPPKTWDSERAFFDWLGMKYLEPKDRH